MFCQNSNCDHPQKIKLLLITIFLIGSFSLIEFLVSLFTNSLALKADSLHIFGDSFALILALIASFLASKNIIKNLFIKGKIELFSALINGFLLLIMGGFILWESLKHLQHPPTEIVSFPMVITAILGLFINGFNAVILHRDSKNDLNLQGAFFHILGDIISSVGVILAALSVWLFNFYFADTIISFFVAILISLTAIPLIIKSLKQIFDKQENISSYLSYNSDIIQINSISLKDNILNLNLLVKPSFSVTKFKTELQTKFQLTDINLKINTLLEIGNVDLFSLIK